MENCTFTCVIVSAWCCYSTCKIKCYSSQRKKEQHKRQKLCHVIADFPAPSRACSISQNTAAPYAEFRVTLLLLKALWGLAPFCCCRASPCPGIFMCLFRGVSCFGFSAGDGLWCVWRPRSLVGYVECVSKSILNHYVLRTNCWWNEWWEVP